jgi:uncharacterized protein (TIGR02145 family)
MRTNMNGAFLRWMICGVAVLWALGCTSDEGGGDDDDPAECEAGTERCSCDDGACDTGLTCLSEVCVRAGGGSGGTQGGSAGVGAGGNTQGGSGGRSTGGAGAGTGAAGGESGGTAGSSLGGTSGGGGSDAGGAPPSAGSAGTTAGSGGSSDAGAAGSSGNGGAWCDGADNCGTFMDSRDGKTYKWTRIATQKWMAQNLNFDPGPDGRSWCYADEPANCDLYGRLYFWSTLMADAAGSITVPSGVQGLCPPGWHVPSDAEWRMLEMAFGMPNEELSLTDWRGTDEGTKMKAAPPDWDGTDTFGFAALPGGYKQSAGGPFLLASNNIDGHAYFWTATSYNFNGYTYERMLGAGEPRIYRDYYLIDENSARSARCVED